MLCYSQLFFLCLTQEGFTHATGNTKLLLTIANAFYKDAPGDFVLLTIETSRLKSEVKLEQGAWCFVSGRVTDWLAD